MPDSLLPNLFAHLPNGKQDSELFCEILARPGLRIERIVSTGQHSPDNFWYDQHEGEWVMLLQGEAKLRFEDRVVRLKAGDYVDIPPHCRHRVDWTASDQITVWLAVFYAV